MTSTTNRPASTDDERRGSSDRTGSTVNLAVLRGTVANDATVRELGDGRHVVSFDVTTRGPDDGDGSSSTASTPVAWYDPPTDWPDVTVGGSEVVVVGSVRRRFFRVGGATQSRTEVVARQVIPMRRRRQVARAIAESTAVLVVLE